MPNLPGSVSVVIDDITGSFTFSLGELTLTPQNLNTSTALITTLGVFDSLDCETCYKNDTYYVTYEDSTSLGGFIDNSIVLDGS